MNQQSYVSMVSLAVLLTVFGAGCGGGGSGGAPLGPSVSLVNPADEALEVPVNQKVAATFDREMDPASITPDTFIMVKDDEPLTAVAGAVFATGVNALFIPSVALSGLATYTATITSGVLDVAGMALANDYVWSFTTGAIPDVTPPQVSFVAPADQAAAVPVNSQVSATFSEAMNPLTLTEGSTFTLMQGLSPVAGVVTYAGTVATFVPASNLAADTEYTATVSIAAEDLAGNPLADPYVWTFMTGSSVVALNTISLGQASRFAVLAGYAITNVPASDITGDVGISPAAESRIEGFALTREGTNPYSSSIYVTGNIYAADQAAPIPSMLTTAKGDLTLAYNDAAARGPAPVGPFLNPGAGNLGGLTLVPGLYRFTSEAIATTHFTLSGSASDVWVFQIASKLEISSGVQVFLSGGALAKNIFWQVGSSATFGTYSSFKGTVMADQSISMATGASLEGRALAFTGTIALAQNAITAP